MPPIATPLRRRPARSRVIAPRKLRPPLVPMPQDVAPMLAVAGEMPANVDDYAFEYKWDGVRALAYVDGGRLALRSRNNLDITFKYPELHPLADALAGRRAILDGEIVTLDDAGQPSFPRLQQRMQVASPAAVARVIGTYPVWLVLFDVLWLDGKPTTLLPLTERRTLLEELTVEGPSWQVSPAHVGLGAAMLEIAQANGLEGIVAKRLDGIYEPGRRSAGWIKIKVVHRQEFVIGGWVPEESGIAGRVGSMLIGYHDCDGKLRYAGRVGTGLNAAWHERLTRLFGKHARASSPFADPTGARAGVRFLHPRFVAEVEFRRWPQGGMVQQAAFKGLRDDKDPKAVVKEWNHPGLAPSA
jgi:bifunctional non-homologous end joining protein LigD